MKSTRRSNGAAADYSPTNGPAIDSVALTAQVATADRLARAVVTGFDLCCDAQVPLTQLQKIALVKAALLEFDGIEAEASASMAIEAALRRLWRDG
jgi:hypothetical protein